MNDAGSGANPGWTSELPRIPGYYWVRLPGYERAPTIAEIELHDGVLEIMHEGMDGPRGWVEVTTGFQQGRHRLHHRYSRAA